MKKIYTTLLSIMISTIAVNAQTPDFYGVSQGGARGMYGAGCIFKTDSMGTNLQVLDSFSIENQGGYMKHRFVQASSGKIYGVTPYLGKYNAGVLFEYDPVTNLYQVKHHFGKNSNSAETPYSHLIIGTNGKVYGLSNEGGSSGYGTLFEYDITLDTLILRTNFGYYSGSNNPHSSLVEGSPGVFYCLANGGPSASHKGVIFKYVLSTNTVTNKNFTDSTGYHPKSLLKAANGKLYGLTGYAGGSGSLGTLFEYDMALDTIIRKVKFIGSNGQRPVLNSLMEHSNGKLYGFAKGGFSVYSGVLFEYNTSTSTFTIKKKFNAASASYPKFGIVESGANKILLSLGKYPTQYIYEYNLTTDTFVQKAAYSRVSGTYNSVYTGMIKASNGKYYGGSFINGRAGHGYIFEFDNALDTVTVKVDLDTSANGSYPTGGFVRASNGMFYGTTHYGGANNSGTLFEFNPITKSYTKKIEFNDSLGINPSGNIIIATNGKIYGTTLKEGGGSYGAIFEYDIATNTIVRKLTITWRNSGNKYIMQAGNGKIYGTASGGTLFEYNISTNILTTKVNFVRYVNGNWPRGVITQATNGKLYGVTFRGGINNLGTLYEYDIALDSLTTLKHMKDSTGVYPIAGVFQASNGILYGVTTAGNTSGGTHSGTGGVVFSYNTTTDAYTALYNLNPYGHGTGINGKFIQASNGKLYAKSDVQQNNDVGKGRILEYDIDSNFLNVVTSLKFEAGSGSLVLNKAPTIGIKENSFLNKNFNLFPNPTSNTITLDVTEKINQLKIWNISGKLMLETIPTSKKINVSDFQNGMYIIQITTDEGVKTSRFVKR